MPLTSTDWLDKVLAENKLKAKPIAAAITRANKQLFKAFDQNLSAFKLVTQKSHFIDRILTHCFRHALSEHALEICALVAVGGYGRSELLPGSDIDLMILLKEEPGKAMEEELSIFLTFLWDIGLEVGHSVRTIKDCVTQGKADVTVITNMIESRLICGSLKLYDNYQKAISKDQIWSTREFFEAKMEEQLQRHQRYNDTAFNLEPNIKEGPGGLRDLQIIGWVAKRHFDATRLEDLVSHGFLTQDEYKTLIEAQNHLWKIRFALHRLAKRREDRLLFEHQLILAEEFGFESGENNLAIEQFMQQYYRTMLRLERLNDMLLQLFREEILYAEQTSPSIPVNERFVIKNEYIGVINEDVFIKQPSALIEIFVLLQQQDCRGVQATTIRLIREHLHLIDDAFRQNPKINDLFMQFMRSDTGIIHHLRRMNTYGVLAAYIPAFEKIVGRMQYDLFHAYTVDQHTLFVIRNLRRFSVPEHAHVYPLCTRVHDKLEKTELLYLAGLFHDIAKGRDGDHSELGAEDATKFCLQHKLNRKDTRIVSQLVRSHLKMSTVAQRQDISDPDVVHQFAREVGSLTMLRNLFLLTVADMSGTNPKLWNSWKYSLLTELYLSTRKVLRSGEEAAPDIEEIIQENREAACDLIEAHHYNREQLNQVCSKFPGEYFLRHSAEETEWHITSILNNPESESLVVMRQSSKTHMTEIFVYTEDHPALFSRITGTLSAAALSILSAEIFTTSDNKAIDSFIVENHDGEPLSEASNIKFIQNSLLDTLQNREIFEVPQNQRLPRQLKSFHHTTELNFKQDYLNRRTIMEISTMDRPGLLSIVASVLVKNDILVTHAKVSTYGAKVDDIFYISNKNREPVSDQKKLAEFSAQLVQILDKDIDTESSELHVMPAESSFRIN